MKNNNSLRERIELFLDGRLTDSETDELWAELLGSPDDLEYIQTVATLKKMKRDGQLETSDKTLDGVYPIQEADRYPRVLSGYRKYLVAASLLVIGLTVLFRVNLVPDNTAGFEPITMIEFEIERSGDELNDFDRELQYAISHSVIGDLDASLDRLNAIETESLSEEKMFHLRTVRGAIYFNMGLFEEAAAVFSAISQIEGLKPLEREKSIWYLANAQVQLDQYEKAIENIDEVIKLDGAFSRPAKKLLNHIHSEKSSEVVQKQ